MDEKPWQVWLEVSLLVVGVLLSCLGTGVAFQLRSLGKRLDSMHCKVSVFSAQYAADQVIREEHEKKIEDLELRMRHVEKRRGG